MNVFITSVEYIEAHKIRLFFSDGVVREIDFLPFLRKFNHPDYDCYLNEENFKSFQLIDGNLNWNDYHLIFTLESLYKGDV
jgi:hypothetical protein